MTYHTMGATKKINRGLQVTSKTIMIEITALWSGDAWKLKNLLLNYQDFCRAVAPSKKLVVQHL